MGLTAFPNGISSFGIPVLGGGPQIPASTGSYFFVDSNTGSNGNPGTDPSRPLATIDYAVGLCTANKGDVIVVMPGHSESIASATSLVLDVAGINIVGLGRGSLRPTLTFDATASRIPISAANVYVSGLIFMASIASIVSGVTITGNDVTLENCEFNLDATGIEFLQMLDIDAADGVTIRGCKFIAENIAGCNTGIRVDATTYLTIEGCEFRGDFTTAAISGTTGSGAASTDSAVLNNTIENLDTTAGQLLDHHDSSTGIVANNRGFTLYATNVTAPFDPGNCLNIENYVVNAVDEKGIVVPTTAST